jgi:hypothetical protein
LDDKDKALKIPDYIVLGEIARSTEINGQMGSLSSNKLQTCYISGWLSWV